MSEKVGNDQKRWKTPLGSISPSFLWFFYHFLVIWNPSLWPYTLRPLFLVKNGQKSGFGVYLKSLYKWGVVSGSLRRAQKRWKTLFAIILPLFLNYLGSQRTKKGQKWPKIVIYGHFWNPLTPKWRKWRGNVCKQYFSSFLSSAKWSQHNPNLYRDLGYTPKTRFLTIFDQK